jgi:hypothetical protein
MLMTCGSVAKYPCVFGPTIVSVVFKNVFVTVIDWTIYQPSHHHRSAIHCVITSSFRESLAFVFNRKTRICLLHVSRSICRKQAKRHLPEDSKLMINVVGMASSTATNRRSDESRASALRLSCYIVDDVTRPSTAYIY